MRASEPLNPMDDGTCRTIKSQYQQTSTANFIRHRGGVERRCGCLLRKYMKKILNVTKEGVCQAITAHYHKEGVGNIIGGGSSIILATAVIEYEDEIQNVPIPKGSK